MRTWTALLAVVGLTATAHAGDYSEEPNYTLDRFGQFGFGVVHALGDSTLPSGEDNAVDLTFRLGKVWQATHRVRPGGFVELRTVDFDGLETAIGPQLQIWMFGTSSAQLRAGVGLANEQAYALAGVQFGNWLAGVSVTTRRYFDDDRFELAANVELSTVLLALPFLSAAFRSQPRPAGVASPIVQG